MTSQASAETRPSSRSRWREVVQAPRDLDDICRAGGSLKVECRQCGRVALFLPGELQTHWRRKGWDCSYPNFARHLVCRRPEGCGARDPKVTWLSTLPPPDDDPPPPRPRFTRTALPKTPEPINMQDWVRRRRA